MVSEPTPLTEDLSADAYAEANAEAPAYPWGDMTNGGVSGGLTKRERFAMAAMQGAIASDSLHPNDIAAFSVEQADRLLKELAK